MTTWTVVNDEYNDQQADLPGGLWAQIGPESDGGWSWVVFDFDADNDVVASGLTYCEAAAKEAVEEAAHDTAI